VVAFQCTHWCGVCTCVCIHVCGCIPMYTLVWCVCVRVCVCIRVCGCIPMYTLVWCVCVYVVCIRVCGCFLMYTLVWCVYVCVHTRVWLYSNVHISVVCVYVCVCIRVCGCIPMYTLVWCVCTCVCIRVCGCIPMYTLVWCVCVYVCVHTRVWSHSNVHICVARTFATICRSWQDSWLQHLKAHDYYARQSPQAAVRSLWALQVLRIKLPDNNLTLLIQVCIRARVYMCAYLRVCIHVCVCVCWGMCVCMRAATV